MWVGLTWVFVYPSGGIPAMAYNIKYSKSDELIRELARVRGEPMLDSKREACENELQRERRKSPLAQRPG